MEVIRICPSILNADRSNLLAEIQKVASADLLHLDVMDNRFVPNFTFTFDESVDIIEKSSLPVDAHLMIENPDNDAVAYAQAGAASVTFHFEASKDPLSTLKAIREAGARAALAIKPGTPFAQVQSLMSNLDMLLVMTVEPGFGGQKFMQGQMEKVQQAREFIEGLPEPRAWLQVDGGINLETISTAAQAGADTFVAGSAIYGSANPAETIAQLRNAARDRNELG